MLKNHIKTLRKIFPLDNNNTVHGYAKVKTAANQKKSTKKKTS